VAVRAFYMLDLMASIARLRHVVRHAISGRLFPDTTRRWQRALWPRLRFVEAAAAIDRVGHTEEASRAARPRAARKVVAAAGLRTRAVR
jgi:hypothetical protein